MYPNRTKNYKSIPSKSNRDFIRQTASLIEVFRKKHAGPMLEKTPPRPLTRYTPNNHPIPSHHIPSHSNTYRLSVIERIFWQLIVFSPLPKPLQQQEQSHQCCPDGLGCLGSMGYEGIAVYHQGECPSRRRSAIS